MFRFFAAIPLLILAIDGIRRSHPINDSLWVTLNDIFLFPDIPIPRRFWSDTFLMISAIGQFISSLITVMVRLFVQLLRMAPMRSQVFFPRSITRESGYLPRLASVTSISQTRSQAYPTPELVQSPTPMQIHPMHRVSLLDSPKGISHDRASSSPPSFLGHAYSHSSPDIGVEFVRPSELRRRTLPEPLLHPFVRHSPFWTRLVFDSILTDDRLPHTCRQLVGSILLW